MVLRDFLLGLAVVSLAGSCRSRNTANERGNLAAQQRSAPGYDRPYESRLDEMNEPLTLGSDGYRFLSLDASMPDRPSHSFIARISRQAAVRKVAHQRATSGPIQLTEGERAVSLAEWRRLEDCMDSIHFWDATPSKIDPPGGGPFVIEGWRGERHRTLVPNRAEVEGEGWGRCRQIAIDLVLGLQTGADGCRTRPLDVQKWSPSERTWAAATGDRNALCQKPGLSVYTDCFGVHAFKFSGDNDVLARYYDARSGDLLGVGQETWIMGRICWGTVLEPRKLEQCKPVDWCAGGLVP